MTTSRNIGLSIATGDVIARRRRCIAWENWLENLLSSYAEDPSIGAVGGRVLNNSARDHASYE